MAVLAEAGVEVVGENRAQDLEAKHAEYGDAFRWHFIGHLQSKKVRRSSASGQSCTGSNIPLEMGFADVWNRTLVYFGIAEEDDWDEEGYVTDEDVQRAYAERPNVRRLAPRRRDRDFDDWTDPEPDGDRTTAVMRPSRPRVAAVPSPASVRVHLVVPRSFNDAQQIADKFKDAIPVILNLQSSDQDLSKRLIDFASGLTYALDGGMQRVADKD